MSRLVSRASSSVAGQIAAQTTLRAQGMRTRRTIIRAATRLLLKNDGVRFTLRAVARQAKVSVSNLQYYFPDRQELLRGVMAPIIEAYLTDLSRALDDGAAPRHVLGRLVQRVPRNAENSSTMAPIWHFASLVNVDPERSRLFDESYEALVDGIAQLVRRINPRFEPTGSVQFARLLIAMADGLGFQMQARRNDKHTGDLEEGFVTMVDFLLHRNPLLAGSKTSSRAARGN